MTGVTEKLISMHRALELKKLKAATKHRLTSISLSHNIRRNSSPPPRMVIDSISFQLDASDGSDFD